MELSSKRLILRPYTDFDFNFLCSLLADPEVIRYIGNGRPRNREDARKFLSWIHTTSGCNQDFGLKVIIRKSDGRRIGHAGLVPQTVCGIRETEIGYWIARAYWNMGFATEAALTLRDYGAFLGIKRFIALIQPANLGSRHVAHKIGMDVEKTIQHAGQSVCVYSLEQ